MTRAWRVVLWIVMALLAAGIVLAGAGWLTGASLPRMAELLFGGVEEAGAAAGAVVSRAMELISALGKLI